MEPHEAAERSQATNEASDSSKRNYMQDVLSSLELIDRAQADLQGANWKEVSTSGAAKDQRWFAANKPECAKRAEDMMSDALTILLRNAYSHLNGFAILYRNREHFLAPGVLARALLENVGYTFWLIGSSDDDPLDRMARAYLEEFASAEQAQNTARSFSGPAAAEVRAAKKEDLDNLLAEAGRLLGEVSKDESGSYVLRGQKRPGPVGVVSKMYKFWRKHQVTTQSVREAAGIYAYWSSCTHPTLYPARELIREENGAQFEQTDLDFLYRQASVVLDVFTQGLSYVYSYSGVSVAGILQIRRDLASIRPAG